MFVGTSLCLTFIIFLFLFVCTLDSKIKTTFDVQWLNSFSAANNDLTVIINNKIKHIYLFVKYM